MSEITRRQALSQLAAAFAAAGVVDHLLLRETRAAQFVAPEHATALSPHHYRTLERLTDLIIPVENGRPGAVLAGVPAWIDSLVNVNAELKSKYETGLGWLDQTMQAEHKSDFVDATLAQQTALLDVIAFKKNRTAANAAGVDFFTLLRRMTVDGFYTSDLGIREINPGGRPPHATFTVPQEDIDYVIAHSPFRAS
jgi:hypothetical protein